MRLIFKDETVYIRVNGKLIRIPAGADVEIEFKGIDRLKWLRAELRRVMKGGK